MYGLENRLYLATLLIASYLLASVFEAPIRFYAGSGIYLRDMVLFTALAVMLSHRKVSYILIVAIVWLVLLTLWGLVVNRSHTSVAAIFGAKQLIPGIVGVGYGSGIFSARKSLPRHYWIYVAGFFSITFIITLAGCLADLVFGFKWGDATMELLGNEREISREWTVEGIRRIAGLTRSSFDAAAILGISSVVVGCLIDSRWARFVVHLLAIPAVVLTTSKGVVVSLVLVAMSALCREKHLRQSVLTAYSSSFLILTLCAACMLFPIVATFGSASNGLAFSLTAGYSLNSLQERIETVWPEAINALVRDEAVLGYGLGGVGTSVSIFANELYNPMDNAFLFVLTLMGILAFATFPFVAIVHCSLVRSVGRLPFVCTSLAVMFFAYGITTSVLENGWICFLTGFTTTVSLSSIGENWKSKTLM